MHNFLGKLNLAGKKVLVREPACDTKQNGFHGKKRRVDTEIHQILQILGPY